MHLYLYTCNHLEKFVNNDAGDDGGAAGVRLMKRELFMSKGERVNIMYLDPIVITLNHKHTEYMNMSSPRYLTWLSINCTHELLQLWSSIRTWEFQDLYMLLV